MNLTLIDRDLLLSKIYEHPEMDGNKGLIRVLCCIDDAPVVDCCQNCRVNLEIKK